LPDRGDTAWADRHVAEIEASGLTGRGGGGFAAWRKLASINAAPGTPTVVVNAIEGEPASAKDRVLLTCVPHLVLDGAQLTAAAVGANRVVVCIADDQPSTAKSVIRAVGERQSAGVDPVPVEVARPPGAFLTGEESALVSWLDGHAAVPIFRTDRAIALRVRKRPALVHNTETLAHVALISRHGASWFREVGTMDAPGTTLVTVSGAVDRTGVHEVELGTHLSEIVGRSVARERPSAVIVGGYGGSFVGPGDMDVRFSPKALSHIGSSTGAGVIAVIGEGSCGVAETARIARYLAGQSAGQCGPCVFGLPAIASSLEDLWRGQVDPHSLEVLERRTEQVSGRGACHHPDGAVRIVRSALKVFANDFAQHAVGRPCTGAGRSSLLSFGRPRQLERRRVENRR
jgi:NADH:ubiquinone oxidoreductase subunit F (NADH-binding)